MVDAERMAFMKRAKPSRREEEIMDEVPAVHPMIEKTARAISDWQSEMDWPIHTDQAIRAIESVAEQLQREGFDDAVRYLRSTLWNEPKPRTEPEEDSGKYARLFF